MEEDKLEVEDAPFLDDLNDNVLDELDAIRQFEYEGAVSTQDPHPMEYQKEYKN
jgi:hypothetical protein